MANSAVAGSPRRAVAVVGNRPAGRRLLRRRART